MEKLFLSQISLGRIFFTTGASLFIYILIWALIAIRKKRADLADIGWGPGFLVVGWVSFLMSPFSIYSLAINLLITAWALRLAIHIFLRNRNKKEDFRYANLKAGWSTKIAFRIFSQVFLFQGILLYIISLPLIWINAHPKELSPIFFWVTTVLWLAGFLFEAISDYQLSAFKKDPANRGKLLKKGLWSYVRHPNYLGEIIQWWAIWISALSIPFGPFFIISPLLITFLIVKVSGVATLEEKMKGHPDFPNYAKNTPSLIPFSLVNGALYFLAWLVLVFYGAQGALFIPLFTLLIVFGFQLYLLSKFEPESFLISIPLSAYALLFGFIQETLFIYFGLLSYPGGGSFPPFWLFSLYPLFSLTLNTSLNLLNRNLPIAFCIGGAGSILSYLSGETLSAVELRLPIAYPFLFMSWGFYLTILILLNRKLIALRNTYTDREKINQTLTLFFDDDCPICSREIRLLKGRKQTGSINYAPLKSEEELKKVTRTFSYKQAMETIHAIDSKGNVKRGVDALAALYARTDLPLLAILLQAPGFRTLFGWAYAIWAKFRKSI